MSNPFEYRDIMKASMKFNETRTVEQVQAEHEKRRAERTPTPRARNGRTPARPVKRGAPQLAAPSKSQLDALESLRQRALALREAQNK